MCVYILEKEGFDLGKVFMGKRQLMMSKRVEIHEKCLISSCHLCWQSLVLARCCGDRCKTRVPNLEVNAKRPVSFAGELFNYKGYQLNILQSALRNKIAFNFM